MDAEPRDYRTASRSDDPRSTAELITIALTLPTAPTDEDEHVAWNAISALHWRATREVFEAAQALCESDDAGQREVGADILGQLGIPDRAFSEESFSILLALLKKEQDDDVLQAICVALGHLNDPRAIEPLTRLKRHPDPDVRHGVVFGLLTHENDLAIKTLIELSNDEAAEVRDWATFGLGSQIDTDTPEIREALFVRLADEGPTTSGEAMVGLARRKDPRVVEAIIRDLEAGYMGTLIADAAEEIADPRLAPYLAQARDRWVAHAKNWELRGLYDAIAACTGKSLEDPTSS
jgi:HEAT repeat protein